MFSFIIVLKLDVGKVMISPPPNKGSSWERLMRKLGGESEDSSGKMDSGKMVFPAEHCNCDFCFKISTCSLRN